MQTFPFVCIFLIAALALLRAGVSAHGFCATLWPNADIDIDWDIDGCCPHEDGTAVPPGILNFRIKTSMQQTGWFAVGFNDKRMDSLAGSWVVLGHRNQLGQVSMNEYIVRDDGRLRQLPRNVITHNVVYIHWSGQFAMEFWRPITSRYEGDPVVFDREEAPMQFFFAYGKGDLTFGPIENLLWPPTTQYKGRYAIDFYSYDHHVGDAIEKCKLPVLQDGRLPDSAFTAHEPSAILPPGNEFPIVDEGGDGGGGGDDDADNGGDDDADNGGDGGGGDEPEGELDGQNSQENPRGGDSGWKEPGTGDNGGDDDQNEGLNSNSGARTSPSFDDMLPSLLAVMTLLCIAM